MTKYSEGILTVNRSKLGGDEIVEYAKGVLGLWMKV